MALQSKWLASSAVPVSNCPAIANAARPQLSITTTNTHTHSETKCTRSSCQCFTSHMTASLSRRGLTAFHFQVSLMHTYQLYDSHSTANHIYNARTSVRSHIVKVSQEIITDEHNLQTAFTTDTHYTVSSASFTFKHKPQN